MCKKLSFIIFIVCICIGASSAQELLKIDFGTTGSPVEDGYEAYNATLEVANTFTIQSFNVFGTTITVTPTWSGGAPAAAMQMHDRITDDRYAYAGESGALIQDWIGTDGREAGDDTLVLTLGGLPKGLYSWLSYHNDGIDQTGVFSVTLKDASGSATTEDVEITNSAGGDNATDIESVSKFTTEFVSNGTDDVVLEFLLTSSTNNLGTAFFVMNGFEIEMKSGISLNIAKNPQPYHKEQDVFQNVILLWEPGDSAQKHNVFFGAEPNNVENATIDELLGTTISPDQARDANTFDPGTLEFGTKYYWRVDEVNGAPDYGIIKGNVWSFTVEKEALDMPLEKIVKVTASNSMEGNDPNNTINGAGLGEDPNFPDAHSNSIGIWAAPLPVGPNNVWIQYDFDKKYKIHDMQVWNYNRNFFTGYGFKDVLVQYSEDGGQTWTDLPDVNQFAKANGSATYDTVALGENNFAFNDAIANSVRITALSHWEGGISPAFNDGYGLSEVRFTYIPLRARKPSIVDKVENVAFDAILKWRKGREAITHELYIDINETNVNDASINPISLDDSMYAPDLSMGDTYYWRVDEVNPDKIPSVWEGYVWSFSVPSTILIDGFETGYGNDIEENAVFLTWIDGENDSDNGAWTGRDDEPYLHTINHSGGHSVPFSYDNANVDYSEITADTSKLLNGSDWSLGNPKTLTIWFRGDPNNDEVGDSQLYCKIGSTKIVYTGSIDALSMDIWRQWDVDLTGMSLSNVPSLSFGVETIGSLDGYGTIYLDDIMLTGVEPKPAYPDTFIEAEAYTTLDEPMEVNSVEVGDTEASGGEYIHVKNGTTASQTDPPTDGIVTYEVDLDGGQYIIWGRVSVEATSQDAFWVKVDGAETNVDLHTSGWCRWNQIPAGADWHWDDVHMNTDNTNETVTWTIPAGTATISIAYRDTDATNPPRLDALLIVKIGE